MGVRLVIVAGCALAVLGGMACGGVVDASGSRRANMAVADPSSAPPAVPPTASPTTTTAPTTSPAPTVSTVPVIDPCEWSVLQAGAHIKRVNEAIARFGEIAVLGHRSLKQAAYDEIRSITQLTAESAQLVVNNCGWPLPEFPVNAARAVDRLDGVLAEWDALDYYCRNPNARADLLQGTKDPDDLPRSGIGAMFFDMSGLVC